MTIEVRTIVDEELPVYLDSVMSGFLERRDTASIAAEVRAVWDLGRTWAAVDEGRICGTFRSWATALTVPEPGATTGRGSSRSIAPPTGRWTATRANTPEGRWERQQPRSTIVVDEMVALTHAAAVALWRFLAETDWVAMVRAPRRSPADPLPWTLTNARAATLAEVGDGLWVRLLDIPRALEARTYEATGSIVLEVVDPELPEGRIRVALDAGPDGARCVTTDASVDLVLDVGALSAAYLGGTRLRDAVLARGVDEARRGALGEADRLLRTADEPWCSTFF